MFDSAGIMKCTGFMIGIFLQKAPRDFWRQRCGKPSQSKLTRMGMNEFLASLDDKTPYPQLYKTGL